MSFRITPRRKPLLALLAMILSTLVILRISPFLITDIGYLARPLWDKPPQRFETTLVQYYAEGMPMDARCRAHGWKALPATTTKPKVYDGIIFSVELDLLEIRIRELWDVVDYFVIIESNATFTGLTKDRTFDLNRDRFAFAETKIVYHAIDQFPLEAGQSPFVNENAMRQTMTEYLTEIGIKAGDLIIMSDVDEIIRGHTIELLKSCAGTPDSIQLQLRNYLYSYEFYIDSDDWRSSVHKWKPGVTQYVHGMNDADTILSDSGWHCSFCFRNIKDFVFKMQAYSHADRVRYPHLLEPSWIQDVICTGKDLFGMYPEAYTYKDLIHHLGSIPKSDTAVGLPRFALENPDRFGFLLPGGCIRKEAS